jgi:hypothetical protein
MQPQQHVSPPLGSALSQLGALASATRTWGWFSIVLGAIGLAMCAVSMLASRARSTTELATMLAIAAFASVGVLAGARYLQAGRELREIGRAPGDPVESAVAGLDKLGLAFRLEAIVAGMSIALAFAGGLVVGALRSV